MSQARLLRSPRASNAGPPKANSRAPTGSSRSSTIPTAIRASKDAEEKFKEAAEAYAVLCRSAEARGLRSLRARRPRRPGRGRLRPVHLRRLRGHPRRARRRLRVRRPVRRRTPARRAAARRRTCATTSRSPSRKRRAAARRRSRFPRAEACDTCKGSGAAAGSGPTTCPSVPGTRPAAVPAGILYGGAHVHTVPRRRQGDRQALRDLPRRRVACRKERKLTVKHPAGHRDRAAASAARRGRARRAGRAAGRPVRRPSGAGPRVLPA